MPLSDDPGFALVLQRLAGRGLPPLDAYKDNCLRRRLQVRLRACGVRTLTEYAQVLETTPDEVERLREALTINVTGFFRNPETWERLRSELPALVSGPWRQIAAWSAGCASGEEAWTLAALLATVMGEGGIRVSSARLRVDATDIDTACLATTAAGVYPDQAFTDAPAPMRERWTVPDRDGRRMVPQLLPVVRALAHDMTRDHPPDPPYHLIVCRNVMIYFTRPVQEALFARFAGALRPGGLLVLGKVESVSAPARDRFAVVDHRERIFRRTDD